MQDRKDKGICYRCDEKNFVGHRCKNKQLQVLLVEEDDTEREMRGEEDENDQPLMADVAKLSMNLVVDISTPKTVKLR